MANNAQFTITIKTTQGNAIEGLEVTGLLDTNGAQAKTNAEGIIKGVSSVGSINLKIADYGDIVPLTKTYNINKGEIKTEEWTITTRNFVKISSSGQYRFSNNVSRLDVCCVGGGGGGAGSGAESYTDDTHGAPGPGGGGGQVVNQESVAFYPNTYYKATVGSGGVSGESGLSVQRAPREASDGGQTSFITVSAEGGKGACNGVDGDLSGGSQYGSGGNATSECQKGFLSYNVNTAYINGSSGSGGTEGYASFTTMEYYGGGGGSGAFYAENNYSSNTIKTLTGGAGAHKGGKGGNAGWPLENISTSGSSGTEGGGGGGGGLIYGHYGSRSVSDLSKWQKAGVGGTGGKGLIALRMHLKME